MEKILTKKIDQIPPSQTFVSCVITTKGTGHEGEMCLGPWGSWNEGGRE